MSRAKLTLTYDGPALRTHEMNVRDLAPAMLALGEVFEVLNTLYNGTAADIAVNVRAHEPGCFSVVFDVVQGLRDGAEFLAGTEVTAAANLVEVLFGGGTVAGGWLKTLKGAIRDQLDDDANTALPNGVVAPFGTLRELVSLTPGQRIGYVTDIRDSHANMAAVARLSAGADPLFIEASFPASEEERAQERGHLPTTAAGRMAKAAGARRVEPFHFSPRNRLTEDEMLAEVDARSEVKLTRARTNRCLDGR